MRVFHLISSGGMYGAEAVILNLSHRLREEGDQSSIAVFANSSLQLYDRARSEGLHAFLIPCKGPWSPESVKSIRQQASGYDLLHAHGYKADLYAWAALRNRQIALISTCHTWYDNDIAVRLYGAMDRRVLRRFSRVVAVSEQVKRRLLKSGVDPLRVRIIQNGVDLRPFATAAERRAEHAPLLVGLVGRLAPEKGVDIFIEAAAMVLAAMPSVRFVVVGDGPERGRLERQIQSLGLEGRLTLLGRCEAMTGLYEQLDLLVSASRQEGLPVALLEGMASGLAVVATMVGEVPALVQHDETGLLTVPENAAALADAMQTLLRDRERRLLLGRQARELIERKFSVEQMAAAYRAVYTEAAAS